MNKEEASKELGISVRSLQRLVESGKISVTHKRGKSGKQEAFFNAEELADFKNLRDSETIKPATVSTNDTALARNVIQPQLAEVLHRLINPEQKNLVVAIADKPLLKLDEASALTGLSQEILRKAIKENELKGRIIGRAYRIKREDLDNYIAKL